MNDKFVSQIVTLIERDVRRYHEYCKAEKPFKDRFPNLHTFSSVSLASITQSLRLQAQHINSKITLAEQPRDMMAQNILKKGGTNFIWRPLRPISRVEKGLSGSVVVLIQVLKPFYFKNYKWSFVAETCRSSLQRQTGREG